MDSTKVKIVGIGDPTALGLFGFGVVTLVAASQKLGITSGTAYIIPWAIFVGGIMQMIAGIIDFKNGSIFGGTAFTAYGSFWIAVAFSWLTGLGLFGEELRANIDGMQFGFGVLAYLFISIFLTIGSMKMSKTLFIAFVAVDVLLISLTLSNFGISPEFWNKVAGLAELVGSLFAFYTGGAGFLAGHFGKPILPTGKAFNIFS